MANLESVIRRLNPNVPAGLGEDALPRIDRDSNAMRQIPHPSGADPLAKVLLAGHIGVGKSTELLELGRQMERDRLVIRFSVAERLGVHNVSTFALLLVVLEAALQRLVDMKRPIPPGIIEQLKSRLNELLRRPARSRSRVPNLAEKLLPSVTLHPGGEIVVRDARPRILHATRDVVRLYGEMLQRIALRAISLEEVAHLILALSSRVADWSSMKPEKLPGSPYCSLSTTSTRCVATRPGTTSSSPESWLGGNSPVGSWPPFRWTPCSRTSAPTWNRFGSISRCSIPSRHHSRGRRLRSRLPTCSRISASCALSARTR